MQEEVLTPEEAAKELKLATKTVKDWLRSGKLKGVKFGRQWRVLRATWRHSNEPGALRSKHERSPTPKGVRRASIIPQAPATGRPRRQASWPRGTAARSTPQAQDANGALVTVRQDHHESAAGDGPLTDQPTQILSHPTGDRNTARRYSQATARFELATP